MFQKVWFDPHKLRAGTVSFSKAVSFLAATSDGSDNLEINFGSGGALSSSRGAFLRLRANEHATNAIAYLSAGNVAGSGVTLDAPGGNVDFYSQGVNWRINATSLTAPGIIDFTGTMGNSTKDPRTDAPTDWVHIRIGGTAYYLPAYLA